ncbi:Galectin-3-binding protein A [Holothuria leucospilota]|uniref:Galectin-3-binding protein A n=1 Tax=Holothuria leucospilota TaxID=206669 RepID=A0A9Q1GVS5_HOLLE|nr:Galectin-3-binding protein A [Holothuria leucospilota]
MDTNEIFSVFVWTFLLPYFASSSEVRLVDGSRSAGRVEVYRYGQWGTVCDDFWDLSDATVVCRQLGFVGANEAIRYARFGVGSGPIYFDDVDCIGNEVALEDCSHTIGLLHDCSHYEDAGVSCKEQSYGK